MRNYGQTIIKCHVSVIRFTFVKKLFVTGFCKTSHIVTVGLLHFIGAANAYTHTLPLPGLANWSAFLEQVLKTL